MRIGMLADIYKPHVSGVTNYISLNKEYMESLGHEVFVFCFGEDDIQDEVDNVIRTPGIPLMDKTFYLSLRYNNRARKLVRTMDVVHVNHPILSGSLALRYCRPLGIPIVFTNHTRYDLYVHAYLSGVPSMVGEAALQAYLPSFCKSCDVVISPSEGMKGVLRKMGVEGHIEVIPNGVDLMPFQKPIQPFERKAFNLTDDDIILVYTGRLGPEKNIPFLLRAFAGALQAYDYIGLVLIGDGPERENLQDRVKYMGISDRVRFTGLVPYDQMPRYLKMADAFVTASLTEVHPLTVIEAMAAELPVLGIQSPGVGDTVIDGETGFLVEKEDMAAFTAKMVRIVVDNDMRKEMSNNARESAKSYAIEETAQSVLDQYQKVIEGSTRRRRGIRAAWGRFKNRIKM